jgi:hypothetical protein
VGLRYNPPPGWPPAPEGFSPPPGWQPDPSWPPPPGWQLWVNDDQMSTRTSSQQTIQAGPPSRPPLPGDAAEADGGPYGGLGGHTAARAAAHTATRLIRTATPPARTAVPPARTAHRPGNTAGQAGLTAPRTAATAIHTLSPGSRTAARPAGGPSPLSSWACWVESCSA